MQWRRMLRDVIGRHLFSGDVPEYCLQVAETGLVSIRDHLCSYRHGGLEHVYYSVSFRRGVFQGEEHTKCTDRPTSEDYLVVDIYAAGPGRMGIYTQENYGRGHAESFHFCA